MGGRGRARAGRPSAHGANEHGPAAGTAGAPAQRRAPCRGRGLSGGGESARCDSTCAPRTEAAAAAAAAPTTGDGALSQRAAAHAARDGAGVAAALLRAAARSRGGKGLLDRSARRVGRGCRGRRECSRRAAAATSASAARCAICCSTTCGHRRERLRCAWSNVNIYHFDQCSCIFVYSKAFSETKPGGGGSAAMTRPPRSCGKAIEALGRRDARVALPCAWQPRPGGAADEAVTTGAQGTSEHQGHLLRVRAYSSTQTPLSPIVQLSTNFLTSTLRLRTALPASTSTHLALFGPLRKTPPSSNRWM